VGAWVGKGRRRIQRSGEATEDVPGHGHSPEGGWEIRRIRRPGWPHINGGRATQAMPRYAWKVEKSRKRRAPLGSRH